MNYYWVGMKYNMTEFPCLENNNFDFLAHIGFGLLALSYLMKKEIHLRLCLTFSSFILALWGGMSLSRTACITSVSWNSLFCIINAIYAFCIIKTNN